MQYLLSEEEYMALVSKQEERDEKKLAELQKLCTLVADKVPIVWPWGDKNQNQNPRPWGCILSVDREWYCDHCLAQELCPCTRKHWSK